jgi:hypothetical protein
MLMILEQTAGILLIAGLVLVLIASFVGPNAVYTAPDSNTRLEIIAKNEGRWKATNLIWAVGSLITAVGMLLISLGLRKDENAILLYLAAAAFITGAVAWAVYTYQRIGDPAENLYTTPPALLSLVFAYATIAGLAPYGLAFLLGSYPNWLGYTFLFAMGLLSAGMISFFDAVYASFPPQFFYLLTLIVGIVALRR